MIDIILIAVLLVVAGIGLMVHVAEKYRGPGPSDR